MTEIGLESPLPSRLTRLAIAFGKYHLLERINIGGMAEVLKARDASRADAPIVAIKRILPHLTEDRQFVTMFLDESRMLAQLEHDNVIRTLEVGQVGETPYIALEYVWGQDARMVFHRARRSEQPIPISVACYIIAQTCAALHYAHELADRDGNLLGVVHRDVSLQNILLSYDGAVRLTDFGIAMSSENVARTEVGIIKGKFGYMSPEQIRGEPMDRRSDVFATGICLYELLTGSRLFSGDSDYAAVQKVRNVQVDPPSHRNRQIPSVLEAIVMRALSKQPRNRFQTAAELRRALLAFMAESRQECSDTQLARYMRSAFAAELRKHPTPDSLMREGNAPRDEPTGLAAFDALDPVSTVSSPSAVQRSPHVQGDSAVFPARDAGGAAGHEPVEALEWEDEQLVTANEQSGSHLAPAALEASAAYDNDVTRQLYVGDRLRPEAAESTQAASLVGAPSPFAVVPPPRVTIKPDAREASRSAPAHTQAPSAEASYAAVVGIVVGIVALIAGALWVSRGANYASVSFATVPAQVDVRLDGRHIRAQTGPFELKEIVAGVEHHLEVARSGYHTWSTHLSLRSGQALHLPVIALVPEPTPGPSAREPVTASNPPSTPTTAAEPKGIALDAPPTATDPAPIAPPGLPAPPERVLARSPIGSPKPTSKSETSHVHAGVGVLRINSRPWSRVRVDGRSVGNTPLTSLELRAGTHSVRLVNPQFGLKKTIRLRITAGETLTKVVDLQGR